MMRIVFWQYIQSPHQSAYIKQLAQSGEHEVILVTQDDIPKRRFDMGWNQPDYASVSLVHKPGKKQIIKLLYEKNEKSTHIFSSIGVYPLVHYAFKHCPESTNIGVVSEGHNWHGFRGLIRLALGKYRAFRFNKKINFILAIGTLGYKWFSMCGYPDSKINQFGYFVENTYFNPDNSCSKKPFRIGFTAQLIYGKGLDLLFKALAELKSLDWELGVVGDGEKRSELQNLAIRLRIADRVIFYGAKSNQETVSLMQNLDLFVLPSRWDGWGAVVNEALMNGVPVVCSDLCGASSLLRDKRLGETFRANNYHSLKTVLSERIEKGKLSQTERNYILKWSDSIKGNKIAGYLLEVIEASITKGHKPQPPWLPSDK